MTQRCLGKHPARADARRLQFAAYTTAALPPPPATCDRTYGINPWGIMKNDTLGDCAYASVGHMIMAWSRGASGTPLVLSDQTIVSAYATGTGYNPATGAGDNGSNLVEVQEQWRSTGIGGNKIAGYGALDLRNPLQTRESIYYYGGAYIGVMLPESAMQQTDAGLTWTTPWWSPIAGGHAIPLLSYDDKHLWTVTWGKAQAMTWDFYFRYCDESYVVVDPLWIQASGVSPSNLNLDALVADLGVVAAKSAAPPVASRAA
jgi:hypothetical protein